MKNVQTARREAVSWSGEPRLAEPRWRALPRELLLILGGVVVYFGVRGLTETDPAQAVDHALDVVHLETRLGIYVEPALQGVVTGSTALMTAMNWVYIWGHWPVIGAVLLWLFLRHPAGYRQIRSTMVLSGGIGLVIFALFPVAPPRLAELGLVDTVTDFSSAYRVLQPPAFVNQYAAMPSLHVGWDLLMGYALFTWARGRLLRTVGVVLPLLMTAAVVLTANHYVIDAVAGAALVVGSLVLVRRRESRRAVIVLPRQSSLVSPAADSAAPTAPIAASSAEVTAAEPAPSAGPPKLTLPAQRDTAAAAEQPAPRGVDLRQHC